jgi:phosphoribosylanthranilate isomerase
LNNSKIKICGIRDIKTLDCCIENKVDFFGMIFYPKSPRNIPIEKALNLINFSQNKLISSVGVFVNEPIDNIKILITKLNFEYIQLHGEENYNYIAEIKKSKSIKVIKNIPIRSSDDFFKTKYYNNVDMFLFDYKPAKDELPGGNAKAFSWNLISDIKIDKPWFLSGGINIKNINQIRNYAIPYGIDISSGVEDKLGIKSNDKIISLLKFYDAK